MLFPAAGNLNFNNGNANMNNTRAHGYSVHCVQNLLFRLFQEVIDQFIPVMSSVVETSQWRFLHSLRSVEMTKDVIRPVEMTETGNSPVEMTVSVNRYIISFFMFFLFHDISYL